MKHGRDKNHPSIFIHDTEDSVISDSDADCCLVHSVQPFDIDSASWFVWILAQRNEYHMNPGDNITTTRLFGAFEALDETRVEDYFIPIRQ
jgi:hypothetical protein